MAIAETAVGVPDITPVDVSRESPVGNAGEMLYPLTVPEIVGLNEAMADPTLKVFGEL